MKRLGFAAVLGYLTAGVAIGPWGLRLIDDVEAARHLAEFGVILLLFVIGLELQPARLWALRRPIFGMGLAQLVGTALLLGGVAVAGGLAPIPALIVGCGLAMSSTAFVLQLLAEKRELGTVHGRAGFAILLFQDLAVIPLLAVVPLLASGAALAGGDPLVGLAKVVLMCAALFAISRHVLRPMFDVVARTGVPELFTATALLVVVATTVAMHEVNLPVTLGAFLAGVLLADSEYRHEIEARIAPFEGLLLGLFFISVGMAANLGLLATRPLGIALLVGGLLAGKLLVLYAIGRAFRLSHAPAVKLAAVLCQGGEFAFILFALARDNGLLGPAHADVLMLVVTLSMAATPLVHALVERGLRRGQAAAAPAFDIVTDTEHQVIIAGFGRFGQICGRVLHALRIPFTALDVNPEQIALVARFGNKAYYGDASNLDLLRAARVDRARVMVVAIDDPDAAVRTVEIVRQHFPAVEILARARNRRHVYRLMELGVGVIERELYHSSLALTEQLLLALDMPPRQAHRVLAAFRRHDEAALRAAHAIYKDEERLIQTTKEAAAELQALFETDASLRPDRDR